MHPPQHKRKQAHEVGVRKSKKIHESIAKERTHQRCDDHVKKHKHKLSLFPEVPVFLKREHILTGYRMNYSYKDALKTGLFSKHNETGNIYTHLVSLVIFGYLFYDTYTNVIFDAPFWEKVVFGVFFCSAMFTYLCSTVWHVFGCHSEKVYAITLSFDYVGIAFLTIGSFVPPLYFSLACHPTIRAIYISLICILGVMVAGMLVLPHFRDDKYMALRTLTFVALSGFSIFPMSHSIVLFGFERVKIFLMRVMIMFSIFGIGVIFYAFKFPERFLPGYFDHWLHSHQIWHVFTFLGPLSHYFTILEVYNDYLSTFSKCDLLAELL